MKKLIIVYMILNLQNYNKYEDYSERRLTECFRRHFIF